MPHGVTAKQLFEIIFGVSFGFAILLVAFALCARSEALEKYIFYITGSSPLITSEERVLVSESARSYIWHGVELPQTIFSSREILHMSDVKNLFNTEQALAVFTAILAILSGSFLFSTGDHLWRIVHRTAAIGAVATLTLGTLIYFFFNHAFLMFHQVSFSNDFWLLDPAADVLIRVYTADFFRWFMFLYCCIVFFIFITLWIISRRRLSWS